MQENKTQNKNESPSPADERAEEAVAGEKSGGHKEVSISLTEYEELKTLAEERDEYLDRLRRAVADRMTLQKRIKKIKESAQHEALRKVARKVLPVADSLARALQVAEQTEGADRITEGLRLTEQEFYAMLSDMGIELIDAVGQPFDPNYHEAVFQQPSEEAEPNTVLQEIKKGFLIEDDLLRPAQVVVSAPPYKDQDPDENRG
jgi:molecular chaperone GrpE